MPYNSETKKWELTELEKEFERAIEEATPLIEEKLAEAKKYINEAVELSEKYGVPFETYFTGAPNLYFPDSISKYEISYEDQEILEKHGLYTEYGYGSPGWQRSYC